MPKLLVQITNPRVHFFPGVRLVYKLRLPAFARNRRQLEKIPRQHHLHPAERFFASLHRPTHSLHGIKQTRRKHRHLVNHEDFCFLKSFIQILFLDKVFNIPVIQIIFDADAGPRMNCYSAYVRGG